MKKQILTAAIAMLVLVSCNTTTTNANVKAEPVSAGILPAPVKTGGMPMMEALDNRKTQRNFSEKELSAQELSNLLWAASGVNREDGRMTAPTASNNQQIVIFVATKDAVYEYLNQTHELRLHLEGDHRAVFGRQPFVGTAPLVLGFVSDWNKMERYGDNTDAKRKYSYTDAGNVSQNVYLFCASAGLGTVAIGNYDAELFARTLNLTDNYLPVLNQALGFPAD
jgi:nitroreductase